MTIVHAAGVTPIVCALIVTIAIRSVILYPEQTATTCVKPALNSFVGRL
jgi:hypothetical protein